MNYFFLVEWYRFGVIDVEFDQLISAEVIYYDAINRNFRFFSARFVMSAVFSLFNAVLLFNCIICTAVDAIVLHYTCRSIRIVIRRMCIFRTFLHDFENILHSRINLRIVSDV